MAFVKRLMNMAIIGVKFVLKAFGNYKTKENSGILPSPSALDLIGIMTLYTSNSSITHCCGFLIKCVANIVFDLGSKIFENILYISSCFEQSSHE